MLRIQIRFPLGVYHGIALGTQFEAEWPPSPLRLVGALLAAAHARPGVEPAEDRATLQRLCDAAPPIIVAPDSVAVGEPVGNGEVVRLRGVTRWAPRNYISGPVSPRNLGRERAAVGKPGVAIGDRSIAVIWPDVEFEDQALKRLRRLASDIAFVGTTRSPAIVTVDREGPGKKEHAWEPAASADGLPGVTSVRVPDRETIAAFDRRHAARATGGAGIRSAGMVPAIPIGREVRYRRAQRDGDSYAVFDPRWWGEMIVLAIDRAESETLPKTAAAYMLARATRVALLGGYAEEGCVGEAPPILRGRGSEPHCAVVPLSNALGDHADQLIRGIAVVLPHEDRVPDLAAQRDQLIEGLQRLCEDSQRQGRRHVAVPGAGAVWLRWPDARQMRSWTLQPYRYSRPSRRWRSVTPVVHSRWRKSADSALTTQIAADCEHVGLPEPAEVEVLRGGSRMVSPSRLPPSWRALLGGPAEQVRLTFDRPVAGPVLLGRARHFGLGLCVPEKLDVDELVGGSA